MKKILVAAIACGLISGAAFANHSWGNYHWARTTSSFNLTVVNSTTSAWDAYVGTAVSDWSDSSKLNMIEDTSGSTSNRTRRQCKGPSGKVRICNYAYGNTGWLGIAGISIDSNGHITTGYTKLNDTYFSQSYYNNFSWKQAVTCQELGHNIGLAHQDEDFNNSPLFSCMDYQDPPYEYPNSHDYNQLLTIYGHTDSYNTASLGGGVATELGRCDGPCSSASDLDEGNNGGWGLSMGRHGALETFIRIDRDGTRHLTHVLWIVDHDHDDHEH